MKKAIPIVLTITLILALAGCKNIDNTYSESELSSAPLISSTTENTVSSEDDGSDISVFSLDESKTNSSSTSVTSSASTNSKVDSSENTVSTEKSNSTQTITENNPTTYFEKHNLKITPISNELCFNNDPNHQCPYDKDIGITVTSVPERFYYSFDVKLFDDNFDISTYKAVQYYDYAVDSQKWEDCHMSDVVAFDKYSGKTIDNGTLTKYGWQELIFNDKKIYVMMFNGVDESGYWHIILCPVEYDGAIFAVLGEDKDFGYITSNNCLIEKFIDLKNDKYYLFAEKS